MKLKDNIFTHGTTSQKFGVSFVFDKPYTKYLKYFYFIRSILQSHFRVTKAH